LHEQAFSVQTHCPSAVQPQVLQSTVLVSPSLHVFGQAFSVHAHPPPEQPQLLQPSWATLVSPSLQIGNPPVVDPPQFALVQVQLPFAHEQMLQPSLAFAASEGRVQGCPWAAPLTDPTGARPPQPLATPRPNPKATVSHPYTLVFRIVRLPAR
jgi:hypothetical protein